MAKIEWSGIGVTAGRGKLGDQVYSKNLGGSITRAYASPVVNPNFYGLLFRDTYADGVALWQTMDEDYRVLWNEFAKVNYVVNRFGQPHLISGFNWFMKQNLNLVFANGSFTFKPLAKGNPNQPTRLDIVVLTPTVFLMQLFNQPDTAVVPDNHVMFLCASDCVSAGITRKKTGLNVIATFPAGTNPSGTLLRAAWVTAYGTPIVGKRIFFKVYFVDLLSATKSNIVTANDIVVT